VRNLDADTLAGLHARAAENGRSLQAELHAILRDATTPNFAEARAVSRKWRERLKGRVFADSTELLREDRER
jgi:plasmid stability protein